MESTDRELRWIALGGEGRLDLHIAKLLPELTRSAAANLIRAGDVTVNGISQKTGYALKAGDEISVTLRMSAPSDAMPQDIPIEIVYEDTELAVINKPRNMVVHPAPGNEDGTLVNALLFHMGDMSQIGGQLRPGIVHRIDKDTSGLLVVAKNDEAHRGLSAQLSDKTMGRIYLAIVDGAIGEDGTVDAPVGRSRRDRKKMDVVPGGRHAVTHYAVLERYRGFTLLQCRLETGRTHQIRVHMAHIGHPVAGDPVYGGKDTLKLGAQALHAYKLYLRHPATGERMEFTAPPPEDFQSAVDKLRRLSGYDESLFALKF